MVGGLPFELVAPKYDKEMIIAVKQADNDIATGKLYTHEEIFDELKAKASAMRKAKK